MKPTKSKVYCLDAGRSKILFESEKKAGNFLKFNTNEILKTANHAPVRSYFCKACNGWHVTSSAVVLNIPTHVDKVMDSFHEEQKNRAEWKEKLKDVRHASTEMSLKLLEAIDKRIAEIQKKIENKAAAADIRMLLEDSLNDLASAKKFVGHVKRKKILEIKLAELVNMV